MDSAQDTRSAPPDAAAAGDDPLQRRAQEDRTERQAERDSAYLAAAARRSAPMGTLRHAVSVIATGVRLEPWVFAAAVLGAAVYGVGTAGAGWVLGRVTEDVLTPAFNAGSVTADQLASAGGALAAVALLTAAGIFVRRLAAGTTMYRLQARYRRAVTRQYLRLPVAWHHRHPAGQLLSRANADVEAIWQVLAPLPMSLGVAVMLLVAAVAMVAADPVLAVLGLVVIPALVALNAAYSRRMSPLAMRAQELRGDVSAVAHESFEGAQVVKTLGKEASETRRFEAVSTDLRDANIAVGRLRSAFDPALDILPTLTTLLVLLVGTARVAAGQAQTADVVQISYLLTLLAFPVRALGWVLGELPRTVVGWQRVATVLAADDRITHGEQRLAETGDRGTRGVALRASDVHLSHRDPDGSAVPALTRVDLDVAAGRTVAVVGPTGAGKSTLVSLLVRLLDPDTGTVLLAGVDARGLAPSEIPRVASLVPQAAFVFDDSVRDNVTLGAAFTDEQVWQALREARADGFVAELPGGLDTVVGEQGTTLSGGQRQRLALARALIRRPRLLVMDDATSAVDPAVEQEILASLRASGGPAADGDAAGATVVLVAHRMATIALADEVVLVEGGPGGGTVTARGTHEELLTSSPTYRELVTAYETAARERADREGARA